MTRLKHILVGRNPKRTMIRAAFLAIASLIIFGWLARPVRVQGISMEPTVHNGSIHFLNLTAYWWRDPQRQDMVAVAMPGGRSFYMKRVLGLPGETISFLQGALHINGVQLAEPYLNSQGNWELEPLIIPDRYYFVAGDNRNTPFSGHTLGLVERRFISGVLLK